MPLIPCNADCIYCEDGYCGLNTAAIVSNTEDSGCFYRIKKNAADSSATQQDVYQSVIQEPQTLA